MIARCDGCGSEYKTLPSWYAKSTTHYCNQTCFMESTREARTTHIKEVGKPHRFKPGHETSPNRKMQKGTNHYAWKGEKVGYRGLHYWLRRVKGVPGTCTKCGDPGRNTQWANIDGDYHRNPDDYVSMCVSCHKLHDLNLRAIRDTSSAS